MLVHRSRAAELERRLMAAYGQVRIGDPSIRNTLMGPFIDAAAVARYSAAVAAAQAEGGRLFYGGKVLQRPGNFVEPTIIRANAEMPVVGTETFAPILYLLPLRRSHEAIALQNSVPYGLSSAIFSDSVEAAERFLSAGRQRLRHCQCQLGNLRRGDRRGVRRRERYRRRPRSRFRFMEGLHAPQTNTINWSGQMALAQGIRFRRLGDSTIVFP